MDKRFHTCPHPFAVVMLFQFTWIGMLFDCIVNRRLPKRIEVISLIFLFGGTIFAAGVIGADISNIPWQGWAWGMASAVSFSSFVMINQRQVKGMDTETRLLFTSFFAAIVIFFFQSPEIVWNGVLWQESLDLWINTRVIRHCHSNLLVLNCRSQGRHRDSVYFKRNGTARCGYRIRYSVK